MRVSPELAQKVLDVLAKAAPVTDDDRLRRYSQTITLTPDFVGYCNPLVTSLIDRLAGTHVSHVKFVPMLDDGYLIMLAARPGEPGAVELDRYKSRRTCEVNMRLALMGFHLTFAADRKLRLEVLEPADWDQGPRYLLIRVKQPASLPREARNRTQSPPRDPAAV